MAIEEATRALQRDIAREAAALLRTMDVRDGRIVPSPENIALIAEVMAQLRGRVTSDDWIAAVIELMGEFDEIEEDVIEMIEELAPSPPSQVLDAIKAHFQVQTMARLADPALMEPTVFGPIDRAIAVAAAVGGALNDLIDEVDGIATAEGVYASTVAPVVDNAKTIMERSATQAASDAAGIDIFFYQGSEIDTTREFCAERAGRAWHRKEIEAWADEEWDGKVEGTNKETIYIYLGGWYGGRQSCRHVLVPIALRDAPKDDVERMRSKGLIP